MNKLIINHNAGFFSNCSVRLHEIIQYFNLHKKLPDIVDTSQQFSWYKENTYDDITFKYFEHYNNYNNISYILPIDYLHTHQYLYYSNIKYKDIIPFIKKYFTPSLDIKNIIYDLENKYNIDYNNICVLFYRGNDKETETQISSYDDYILYANKILKDNQNIKFFIQSDETEFIDKMITTFPNNSFYMKDEIRHIKKAITTVDLVQRTNIENFSKLYLAITIIMSKCKYIICGSGNCSIWIMLYRENNNNVYQFLNGQWYY